MRWPALSRHDGRPHQRDHRRRERGRRATDECTAIVSVPSASPPRKLQRPPVVDGAAGPLGDGGERQERGAVDVVGQQHQQERPPGGVVLRGGTDGDPDDGRAVDDEVGRDVEEAAGVRIRAPRRGSRQRVGRRRRAGAVEPVGDRAENSHSPSAPPPQLAGSGGGAAKPESRGREGSAGRGDAGPVDAAGATPDGRRSRTRRTGVKHRFRPQRGDRRRASEPPRTTRIRRRPGRPGPSRRAARPHGSSAVGTQGGVGEAAGHHADGAAQHVVAERTAREPGGVVDGDEGHERDQTDDEHRGQP